MRDRARPSVLLLVAASFGAVLPAPGAGEAPTPAEGAELIGRPFPDWGGLRWLTDDGAPPADENVRARLIRWWTDTCPYCEASLPALDRLRERYETAGLQVIGIYHPKPPRPVADETIRRAARERRFRGFVAIDADWALLRRAWLREGKRRATSVSFLLDREGAIRWIHPGPELHPSDDPGHAACDRAFAMLEQEIEQLLER